MLSFWKRLLQLRKEYKDLFVYGRYELCDTDDEGLFIFLKMGSGMTSLTVANMSKISGRWRGAGPLFAPKLVFSNVEEPAGDDLAPYEARIYISVH